MPKKKGNHGPQFKLTGGGTYFRLLSPILFNLIVDNVVRNWLALTVEDQLVAQEVLGPAVGSCMGIFYTNNGVVGSRDPE